MLWLSKQEKANHQLSAKLAAETVQEPEKKIENAMRVADKYSHAANEFMKICAGNLKAIMESGSAASP